MFSKNLNNNTSTDQFIMPMSALATYFKSNFEKEFGVCKTSLYTGGINSFIFCSILLLWSVQQVEKLTHWQLRIHW